jgi:hypothetical protein
MDGDKTCEAVYYNYETHQALRVSAVDTDAFAYVSGGVSGGQPDISCGSNGTRTDCVSTYAFDSTVDLIAHDIWDGRVFLNWTGDCSGDTKSISITMDEDKTCTANYYEYTGKVLTVTKAGSGSGVVTGSGIDCGNDCKGAYASGTQVQLTATADS